MLRFLNNRLNRISILLPPDQIRWLRSVPLQPDLTISLALDVYARESMDVYHYVPLDQYVAVRLRTIRIPPKPVWNRYKTRRIQAELNAHNAALNEKLWYTSMNELLARVKKVD